MRCDLAYALLQGEELVVYDEFTSVVNRQVAKASSFAISKCVRRNGKKFVAVSCHDDIIEWLQPDWIYNTDTQRFFFAKANTKDRQLNLQYTKLGMQILKGKYGRCSANITI
jgi:ABC-type Mn2+/Zn2+ transport system ATPase subunit